MKNLNKFCIKTKKIQRKIPAKLSVKYTTLLFSLALLYLHCNNIIIRCELFSTFLHGESLYFFRVSSFSSFFYISSAHLTRLCGTRNIIKLFFLLALYQGALPSLYEHNEIKVNIKCSQNTDNNNNDDGNDDGNDDLAYHSAYIAERFVGILQKLHFVVEYIAK